MTVGVGGLKNRNTQLLTTSPLSLEERPMNKAGIASAILFLFSTVLAAGEPVGDYGGNEDDHTTGFNVRHLDDKGLSDKTDNAIADKDSRKTLGPATDTTRPPKSADESASAKSTAVVGDKRSTGDARHMEGVTSLIDNGSPASTSTTSVAGTAAGTTPASSENTPLENHQRPDLAAILSCIATVLSALATIALAYLTWRYVQLTNSILTTNLRAFRDAAIPCVVGLWLYREGKPNTLVVRNIGQGAARQLVIQVDSLGRSDSYERSALSPNEEFTIMYTDAVCMPNHEPQVTVDTTCRDLYNRVIHVRHSIPKDDGSFCFTIADAQNNE